MEAPFPRAAYHNEWLLTNRRGGYALGFGNMINERKYNGLLVAGLAGLARVHVLASLEEQVEWQGARLFLDSHHYPDTIYPQGFEHIVKSWPRPYPSVLYSSYPASNYLLILKEIFFFQDDNGVVVKYTNLGPEALSLTIRPRFSLRDHHQVNPPGLWDQVGRTRTADNNAFTLRRAGVGVVAAGLCERGTVVERDIVFRHVFLPYEASRGYEATEDLYCPAEMRFVLNPGQSNRLVFTAKPENQPAPDPLSGADEAERFYRRQPLPADHPLKLKGDVLGRILFDQKLFSHKEYFRILTLAAEDFLTGDDIVAGYPWFGSWSRDSLICLSGLRYVPGGQRLALRLLRKYGRVIKDGLLPNTFGEGGQGLNYHAADSPLWYVLRCWEFAPRDKGLLGRSAQVVLNYMFNQDLPIFLDDDGLVNLRPGRWALTWMDAVIYDQPVTPRWGKPVEINALWYNALMALLETARAQGLEDSDALAADGFRTSLAELAELAGRVRRGLADFVGPDYLADRIDKSGPVFEIRPNAILALSLPFDWLDRGQMAHVFRRAEAELLTPYGLRSLTPHHPAFKNKYLGNQKQRDLSYHQGTVWTWLLLPYARVYLKLHRDDLGPQDLIKDLTGLIWTFRDGFLKGNLASVAEIWDGLQPAIPKGCPAQAWSVMALLEIEHLIAELEDLA